MFSNTKKIPTADVTKTETHASCIMAYAMNVCADAYKVIKINRKIYLKCSIKIHICTDNPLNTSLL